LKADAIHPNERGQMCDSIDILNLPTQKIIDNQFLDSQKKYEFALVFLP
jgi:hypothetical protein